MSSSDDLADRVKAQIVAAFSNQAYPGDPIVVVGTSGLDSESDALGRAFTGRHWSDVPVAMVRTFKDALPLFTPAAFVYFLPAYLLACIETPAEVDTAFDSVIFSLTPTSSRSGWPWRFFRARAELLDQAQADAIRAFLDMAAQREMDDWARAGKSPPPDRIGRARSYWTRAVSETRRRKRP